MFYGLLILGESDLADSLRSSYLPSPSVTPTVLKHLSGGLGDAVPL